MNIHNILKLIFLPKLKGDDEYDGFSFQSGRRKKGYEVNRTQIKDNTFYSSYKFINFSPQIYKKKTKSIISQ